MIRYWNRLVLLDNNRLTKRVFNADYRLCNNNWCNDVKAVLLKLGLNDYFTNKETINLRNARSRINNYYSDVWKADSARVAKLRTYVMFKDNFKVERYVQLNFKKHERAILAQFRCGILPIRIETGRYVGEQLEMRTCRFCDRNEVENETHFLLNCDFYNNIRQSVFYEQFDDPEFAYLSSVNRLSFLIHNHPRKLAKYLVRAYLKRKTTIYNR